MYAEAVPNGGAGIVNALVNIESRCTVDRNRYRDAEGERVGPGEIAYDGQPPPPHSANFGTIISTQLDSAVPSFRNI